MSGSVRKRYVAGAECPQCGVIDKIYITISEQHVPLARQCNRCGYKENQPGGHNDRQADIPESNWKTIRIKDPHKK